MAEGDRGDVRVVDLVDLVAGRVLDRDDPLVGRLVGERGPRNHVADRPDPLARGAQATVDLDETALVALDPGLVEAQPLDVGTAPGRDHQVVELLRTAAEADRNSGVRRLGTLHLRARLDPNVLLADLARAGLRDLLVL